MKTNEAEVHHKKLTPTLNTQTKAQKHIQANPFTQCSNTDVSISECLQIYVQVIKPYRKVRTIVSLGEREKAGQRRDMTGCGF